MTPKFPLNSGCFGCFFTLEKEKTVCSHAAGEAHVETKRQ